MGGHLFDISLKPFPKAGACCIANLMTGAPFRADMQIRDAKVANASAKSFRFRGTCRNVMSSNSLASLITCR